MYHEFRLDRINLDRFEIYFFDVWNFKGSFKINFNKLIVNYLYQMMEM